MKKIFITLLLALSLFSTAAQNFSDDCIYIYKANVTEVYDGDTITACIDLGFNITYEVKIRLYGIDTPELRGKERADGLMVRDYVRSMILYKDIYIGTIKDKKGKYGRYLGIIYINEINLNDKLVDMGLAEILKY